MCGILYPVYRCHCHVKAKFHWVMYQLDSHVKLLPTVVSKGSKCWWTCCVNHTTITCLAKIMLRDHGWIAVCTNNCRGTPTPGSWPSAQGLAQEYDCRTTLYTALMLTAMHWTILHLTLHFTKLHNIVLHCFALHWTAVQYSAIQCNTVHCN